MAETPVLDPASLTALNAISPEDDGAFLKELMGIFLADTPGRIADIERTTEPSDIATVARAAHSIKGAAGNFGAHRLCEVARDIEHHAKNNDFTAVRAAVPRLRTAFEDVRQAMENYRAR